MTNGLDEDYVKIQKSELDELKSTIEDELKVDIKNQKKMYESSASWRITKPLRWFTNLFRR